jgi:hypothetical protein
VKASDNKFAKLIVQEAADDGSDFSNPDADYRVLFLGEDGALHLKDSAGTVTAVGGSSGAMTLIEQKILGSAGALTFTSIANTYKHLLIRARLRNTLAATLVSAVLRVGNSSLDTGSNYTYAYQRAGTTDSDAVSDSATFIERVQAPGASATASFFGYAEWEILHYANTTYYRQVGFKGGGGTASAVQISHGVGQWKNTSSAIDTVGIIESTASTTWDTGSAAWLYGIS